MRILIALFLGLFAAGTQAAAAAGNERAAPTIVLPDEVHGPKRRITTTDLARIRDIDTISVAPDGERFAILVRQAVPEENAYRTA
jgi:hypothetical protein